MLSGVGPEAHLHDTGIQVVHDLPGVGQNMRVHPNVGLRLSVNDDYQSHESKSRTEIVVRIHCYRITDPQRHHYLPNLFLSG